MNNHTVTLHVTRLDRDLPLPAYARPGDAGLDLHARHDVTLAPGQRALIPTGLAVAIPTGYVGLLHPRSGLAHRHGLGMVNTPGTIDSGYRGEIMANLINLDAREAVTLHRGDRIAQLVIQRIERAALREVVELPPSERGEGGHGSTGTSKLSRASEEWRRRPPSTRPYFPLLEAEREARKGRAHSTLRDWPRP